MRTYLIYSNFPECFCNVAALSAATRTLVVCSQHTGGRSGGGNKYKYIYICVVTRHCTVNGARRASRQRVYLFYNIVVLGYRWFCSLFAGVLVYATGELNSCSSCVTCAYGKGEKVAVT